MLQPFSFVFPRTRIVHGTGCVAQAGEAVRALGRTRCMVVAGPHVSADPSIVARIRSGLGSAYAGWFSDIDTNLPLSRAVEGARALQRERADAIIAVGGGSAIGAAKAIAAIAGHIDSAESYFDTYRLRRETRGFEIPTPPEPDVPTLAVHTTLSGSEVTSTIKVVLPDGTFAHVRGFGLGPRVVFCDPEIAATTPPRILLASAMNALDHNVESYYGRHKQPIRDAISLAAVRLLCEHLPRYAARPDDLDAVGGLLLGSVLSNTCLDSLLILERGSHGFNHAVGHVLRGFYGMLQGDAHAIIMPHGMAFMRDVAAQELAELAAAVGVETRGLSVDAAAGAGIDRIGEIRDQIGMPKRLRERLSDRSVLPDVASRVMDDFSIHATPKAVTLSDVLGVLESAW